MSLNRGNNIQAKDSIFPNILKVGWPPASLVRFSCLSRRVREPVKYYLLDFFDKAPFLTKKWLIDQMRILPSTLEALQILTEFWHLKMILWYTFHLTAIPLSDYFVTEQQQQGGIGESGSWITFFYHQKNHEKLTLRGERGGVKWRINRLLPDQLWQQ